MAYASDRIGGAESVRCQERSVIAATTSSAAPSDRTQTGESAFSRDQFVAIYDEQCEICQAFVSWLKLLDRTGKVAALPILPDLLAGIHPGLELDACLRELHVVTPQGVVPRRELALRRRGTPPRNRMESLPPGKSTRRRNVRRKAKHWLRKSRTPAPTISGNRISRPIR
jgi:hypothetical protein